MQRRAYHRSAERWEIELGERRFFRADVIIAAVLIVAAAAAAFVAVVSFRDIAVF